MAFHLTYGPHWDKGIKIDPIERERDRTKQKVYLARYARQSLFEWEEREVTELQRYFEALADIIGQENSHTRMQEDR